MRGLGAAAWALADLVAILRLLAGQGATLWAVAAAAVAMQRAPLAVALAQLTTHLHLQLARLSRLGRAACPAATRASSSHRSWAAVLALAAQLLLLVVHLVLLLEV